MKKIIITTVIVFILFPFLAFSQKDIDNLYGEYLISKSKKTISMDLKDVSLVDLLKALSIQSGLNFVCTEAIKERKLTLYLENAPLKEALDIIFKANNLTYDYYPKAKLFVVKELGKPSIELMTKVYRLKYVRVKNARMQDEIENILEEENDDEDEEDEGIKAAVEKVLTEYGKVVAEPITNSLVVVDVPSQFPIIDEVIKNLDIPQPKVLIEVEMLDVSKKLIDKLGFKFGSAESPGFSASFTGGSYKTPFPFPRRFLNSINWSETPERTLTLGTMSLSTFNALMEFITSDTSTKFLARPRILTISNETSEVNLTTDEAIGITTTVTDTGTTQEIERTETGTKLRVTPQVNLETREITLVVEVFNKSATESGLELTGTTTGKVMNPEKRGAKSVLRLKDGETLLIGGLIRNDRSENIIKVPLLGDIPWLGKMFTYKSKNDEERELLIFLTPHIVEKEINISGYRKISREQSFLSRKKTIDLVLDELSSSSLNK